MTRKALDPEIAPRHTCVMDFKLNSLRAPLRRRYRLSLAVLGVGALLLVLLPHLLVAVTERALLKLGAERAQVADIDLNLFTGRLYIYGLQISLRGHPTLDVPEAGVEFDWRPLFDKQLRIRTLLFRDLDLNVFQHADGSLEIGLPVPTGSNTPATDPSSKPWTVDVHQVVIRNTRLHYQSPKFATAFRIGYARLDGLSSAKPNQPLKFELYGNYRNGQLYLSAAGTPLAQQPAIQLQLDLASIPMDGLPLPEGTELTGQLASALQLGVKWDSSGFRINQQGSLDVSDLRLRAGDTALNNDHLHWDGPLSVEQSGATIPVINSDGQLTLRGLRLVQQQQLSAHLGETHWEGNIRSSGSPDAPQLNWHGSLVAQGLEIEQGGQHIEESQLRWQGRGDLGLGTPLALNDRSSVSLDGGSVTLPDASRFEHGKLNWDGELAFTATPLQVDVNGRIQGAALNASLGDRRIQQQGVQWDGSVHIANGTGGKPEIRANGGLALSGTLASLNAPHPLSAGVQQVRWQGDFLLTDQPELSGRIELQKLDVSNATPEQPLASLESLTVGELRMKALTDLSVKDVRLSELHVLGEDPEPALKVRAIDAGTAHYRQTTGIQLSTVTIDGLQGSVVRNADGTLQVQQQLAPLLSGKPKSAATAAPSAPQTQSETSPLPVAVDGLRLSGNSTLRFRDAAVQPPFDSTLNIESLSMGALDSKQPQRATPIKLKAKLGQFTPIAITAKAYPFASALTVTADATVDALELPPLSPYTSQYLGYQLQSGHLKLATTAHIDKGKLDILNDLTLLKLELKPSSEKKMEAFTQQLSMPLDAALALLRDSDGTIHLKLPVNGDLDNPKFELAQIINKALGNTMKKAAVAYLKNAIQPYGALISIIQFAGQANRIRLDPLNFPAGESTLSSEQQDYLAHLVKLLKERKQLNIRLCAVATAPDIVALNAANKQAKKDDNPENKKQDAAPGVPRDALLELARQRAITIKTYLVEQQGINSERLFICNPSLEADTKEAPRVELLI